MAEDRKEHSRWRRFRYWLDNYLSRGGLQILKALTVVFLVLFAIVGFMRALFVVIFQDTFSEPGGGVLRQIWVTWLEMTDPGTQAYDLTSSPWFKVFAVVSALLGIVFLSAVIAIMTTSIDAKLQDLRAGRSDVLEADHTLILGWNDRITEVLLELIEANESEEDAAVAILADRDKPEMDEFLRLNVPERATTRIITRSGSPTAAVDLAVVNPDEARSIIVLRGADAVGPGSQQDIAVLKTIMSALMRTAGKDTPIIAEITDSDTREIADTLDRDRVVLVDADEMLAKIIVQTSRTEGLSTVYNEVLSFRGAELYMSEQEKSVGEPFGRVGLHFVDGVPFGLRTGDGEIVLNPPSDRIVEAGDEIIVLAEDDSTIVWSDEPVCEPDAHRAPLGLMARSVERELMIGWTRKSRTIIEEYADYLEPGSSIDVVTRNPDDDFEALIRELNEDIDTLQITVHDIDPRSAAGLSSLDLGEYDNVLLLSQAGPGCESSEHTDSETLTILLRLRQQLIGARPGIGDGMLTASITEAPDGRAPLGRLVTEVLSPENEGLIVQAGVKDVVISNQLVSSVISQLSEEPEMMTVYDAMFSEEGAEIYLKPAELYVDDLPTSMRFADLMSRTTARGEQALGYRRIRPGTETVEGNFGVKLNPAKDAVVALQPGDTIVVLAENEL